MSLRDKIRFWLKIIGITLVSSVVTLSIGYYIGDKGVIWFPTTVYLLLSCLFLGISCLLGSTLTAGAIKITEKGKRLKKRVFFLCAILFLTCIGYLTVHRLRQQTPLTSLPQKDFEAAVANHLELLEIYDSEIQSLLTQIYTNPVFATSGNQPLTPNQEKFLRQAWLSLYDYAFAVDQIRQFYQDWYRFDISRLQRARHVQSYLLWHAADVILYDKALRAIAMIKQNPNAVTFLNAPHPNSQIGADSFSRFQLDLFGADCLSRIYTSELYSEWLRQGLDADSITYSGDCLPLWETIESRLAIMEQMDLLDRSKVVLDADFEVIRKGVSRVWFPLQKGVAGWMGDTRVRRVGKYLITPELREQLNTRLEPGDILLSRKNWYLSNVGLPGFWPHAILYIGQPDKLMAYFDDPAISEYIKTLTNEDITFDQYMDQRFPQQWVQYKAGTGASNYHVIEAIKYGVLLNPLSKACGDYMAAFRPNLDKVAKAQAIIKAFSHIGKPYDFNFDFATDHALVCTELVWRSYQPDTGKDGLRLDLVEIAGRKTLPANEIAKDFVKEKQNGDPQLDFVCFIDANEEQQKAYFSDEDAFLKSVDRPKWSFLQE